MRHEGWSRLPFARAGLCAAILLTSLLAGCTTCACKPWGRDVCVLPGGNRLGWAAKRAITDPWTLIPFAGYLMVEGGGDWDERISEWAIEEKPIFGTKQKADDGGDFFRNVTVVGSLATSFATPSGQWPQWGPNKGKGIAVQAVAASLPQFFTLKLKEATNVERPSGKDDLSFPSTQATQTAAWYATARRNIRTMPVSKTARTSMSGALATCHLLSSWSRVENASHWPSDVLVGMALGNFVSLFMYDALLGPQWRDYQLGIAPRRGGIGLTVSKDL